MMHLRIIAYGTIEGNAWLRKHKDTFPFKIEDNMITADKIHENTGMIMISALPNPYNYKKPLIIYTAQDAKDILYINNVSHGSTDYIILKDEKKLYSGSYDKNKELWSFPIAEH